MISCLHVLQISPAIAEAAEASWWLDKGALGTRYPRPPLLLLQATRAYLAGYESGMAERMERRQKKLERRRGKN